MINTVPRDVPTGMVPAYLEGVRAGMLRDADSGYLGEIEELQRELDHYFSSMQERELQELREKQVYFERGMIEGKERRSKLKGGVK